MNCKACKREIDDDSIYCKYCGRKQVRESRGRTRGNGQGTVYKLPNGKWRAAVTVGYYADEQGKRKRVVRTKTCDMKKDAVAALATLVNEPVKKQRLTITFKELYDKWLPTHDVSKSTLDCYRAAVKYFKPVWFMTMQDIDIDDLQDCLDNCGKGKRTQENMKALCGLVYKYGIPRQAVPENLNLAQFLKVGGDGAAQRESFDDIQIEKIRQQIGKTAKAEYVYTLIYLGFRPSEFLALDVQDYDPALKCFIGGGKTKAGTNRTVTVSPKVVPYVVKTIAGRKQGPLFCDNDCKSYELKDFTEKVFYPVLEAAGIDNPIVEVGGGVKRHKYTPHTCRHTFSTLMKRIDAPSKDKLELIGHTSEEMLRYYQDVKVDDLRRITDML